MTCCRRWWVGEPGRDPQPSGPARPGGQRVEQGDGRQRHRFFSHDAGRGPEDDHRRGRTHREHRLHHGLRRRRDVLQGRVRGREGRSPGADPGWGTRARAARHHRQRDRSRPPSTPTSWAAPSPRTARQPWPPTSLSAASGVPRTSPRWSPSCSARTPASSRARGTRSTGASTCAGISGRLRRP